jgi:hypothetical protein
MSAKPQTDRGKLSIFLAALKYDHMINWSGLCDVMLEEDDGQKSEVEKLIGPCIFS